MPTSSKSILRNITIGILVAFSVSTLLAFSLFVELKVAPQPAYAQFGFGAVVIAGPLPLPTADIATSIAVTAAVAGQTLTQKLWDLAKGIALSFVITFITGMAIKLMQKLESYHIIKDIMGYSDALEFDQYLGKQLNKWILKPKKKSDLKEETNVGSIAAKAEINSLKDLKPIQIEELANLTGGQAKVKSFVLVANPAKISKGQLATITWNVQAEGGPAYARFKGGQENQLLRGNIQDNPDSTTDYILEIYEGSRLIESKCVFVEVAGTSGNRCAGQSGTGQSVNRGLTPVQEKELLRGGIAMLTSAVACGGVNTTAVRNIAIYNAARTRGLNPRNIDPSSGNFYTDMYRMGNPFASSDFQELMMRDTAATLEAEAKANVQSELTSNGLKSLRSEKNGISRTSQTIIEYISQTTNAALQSVIQGASGSFAARTIGSMLANIIVQALLKQDGSVISEYPYCGIAQLATGELTKDPIGGLDNFDPNNGNIQQATLDTTLANPFSTAYVHVNDKDQAIVAPYEFVSVTWYVGNVDGDVFLNNDRVAASGQFNTDSLLPGEELKFTLRVKDRRYGDVTVGTAIVRAVTPGTTDSTGTQSLDLYSPPFRIRE